MDKPAEGQALRSRSTEKDLQLLADPALGERASIVVGWKMVDVEDPDETQEERALRALQNIVNGANVTDESMKLSNEYTDRQTEKLAAWFRSIIRRRR